MDRLLKERLVGAAILVFIAVLFVPELLSGPPQLSAPHPIDTPNPVPTSTAAAVRTATLVLSNPDSASAAALSENETPSVAPAPAIEPPPPSMKSVDVVPEQPRTEPPLESAAPRTQTQTPSAAPSNSFAPIGAKGGWSVQLGSFSSAANAGKLARNLRGKAIRVYVSSQGGKHRVRAGPFPDRAAAERAAAQLKSQGQAVSIIAP